MSEPEYVDLDDLVELTRMLAVGPIRDLGLLDAAAARAQSTAFGEDAYPTIEAKAAALLHLVARNHALIDGNKRLAWLAATVFLELNGRTTALEDDAAFELVMAVSAGLDDVVEIARRLAAQPSR